MLPLFHITGLNLALAVMHMGGKNVVIEKFTEKETLYYTAQEKVTLWGSFPPILQRMIKAAGESDSNLSSLKYVVGLDGPETIAAFVIPSYSIHYTKLYDAANPFADPFKIRVPRLAKKVAAGAEFIQTQCVYNLEKFEKWMDGVRERGLHDKVYIMAGITPMRSVGMAKYMRNNFV